MKKDKIKEIYNKYKEMRKDPRKNAGLKLLGYFIFLLVFILIATITNNLPKNSYSDANNTTTTAKVIDKYVEKQKKLLENKYNINYAITYNGTIYKINGVIENNIVNGYYEVNDNIYKIIIRDNQMFDIKGEIESLFDLEYDINLINVEYILNLVKQNSAFIQDNDSNKTYLYEINDNEKTMKIYVVTNDEDIVEIKINEGNNEYLLKFDK